MWNLKKEYRYRKQTYSYHRVKGGRMRQINWEIGNDVYVLLYVAYNAPLSIEFSRQEYWSGLPFPSPEDLPHPGMEPTSPTLAGGVFTAALPGKPLDGF